MKINPITLGAWAIGGWMWGGNEENDSIAAIQASIDQGVATIDTAYIYGFGYSEEVVAKAIKGRREKVIIATKCGLRVGEEGSDPWPTPDREGREVIVRQNSKPKSIFAECEESLKRLKVEAIDLYQIHWPDTTTPIEESWEAMVQLKKQGKVRAIGVSNYSLDQLQRAHAIHPVDSVQPPYSLINRGIEQDILPFCLKNQIAILAYSPLERGLLTGKVTLDRKFAKGDHREKKEAFSQENRERVLKALEKIRPIADRHHATLAQLVIHCTFMRPGITSAIVGARNEKQAIENAQALRLKLTPQERQEIEQVLSMDLQLTHNG